MRDGIAPNPAPRQRQAYAAEGLPLEYYEAWDTNWYRPWEYFDTIASVNKSLIMSCSLGFPSGQMKLYLDQTGDTQGVAVNVSSGTYSAQCVDDAFWTAPSCRGNHSQCVVMLTGGLGWGVNEMMQKATAFNMPFAVAVSATWTAYTELPLARRRLRCSQRSCSASQGTKCPPLAATDLRDGAMQYRPSHEWHGPHSSL